VACKDRKEIESEIVCILLDSEPQMVAGLM